METTTITTEETVSQKTFIEKWSGFGIGDEIFKSPLFQNCTFSYQIINNNLGGGEPEMMPDYQNIKIQGLDQNLLNLIVEVASCKSNDFDKDEDNNLIVCLD